MRLCLLARDLLVCLRSLNKSLLRRLQDGNGHVVLPIIPRSPHPDTH